MGDDELKIFLYGLPPDSQENTLKDFLEAVVDHSGGVTQVHIPSKKTFAFVTVSHPSVSKSLLKNTLLYCDNAGQFYQLKVHPYVKQQFRRKKVQNHQPKGEPSSFVAESIIKPYKPAKHVPPDHVHQVTPDYGMLSLSKPKRKRRKKDELTVWFGGGARSTCKKRPRNKKKKRESSKLVFHESGSFQFGLLCPQSKSSTSNAEDIADSIGMVNPVVYGNNHELNKAENDNTATNVQHLDDENASESSKSMSSGMQVIIDHDYLGPLCLQFTSPPLVADVKAELLDRSGLPVKDQSLYWNGKKLCDSLNLISLLDDGLNTLTLVLTAGSLKGGGKRKKGRRGGATGGKVDPTFSEKDDKALDEGATGGIEEPAALHEVLPDKVTDEDASGGNEEPSLSQEVPPDKAPDEGATGGVDDLVISEEDMSLMETWGVKTTAAWFNDIGLDPKYGDICLKEDINGRALLLLACKSPDQLFSVFQLKKGPHKILMNNLQTHLKAFELGKPQTDTVLKRE